MRETTPTRQSRTRQIFLDGIFPDLCDGWLFKIAKNKQDEEDYLLRIPTGETIYLSQIPYLEDDCGDANMLLLDFFVEVKPEGKGKADRYGLYVYLILK